jgi:Fuc2NAc and GlcNAc transferase
MTLDKVAAFLAVASAAALMTGLIRMIALSRGMLDVPNSRSSHTLPTPRGGGLAIVVTMLAAIGILRAAGMVSPSLSNALLMGGPAVALIGLVDDVRSVTPLARLSVHVAACAWCAWCLGSLPPINFGFGPWNLGLAGNICGVIFLVWLLNLYNFMDGIDGIAGLEAVSILAIVWGMFEWHGGEPSTMYLMPVMAASVAGFLVWNWPPARIFMGDAGSGFLGLCLGAIGWATVVAGRLTIWVWLILLGAFIVDATVTLLRRWLRGAPLAQAHRSHAYQRLSRKYRSHLKVTMGVLCVNLLWLTPCAAVADARRGFGALMTLIAWAPLGVLAWLCGAGLADD